MIRRNTYFSRILPFFAFFFIACISIAQPKLIINEVSQGTNAKEYVELLVMGTPTCGNNNCLDLRGYYIDDNNGFYASGGSVGIAQGIVRFSQDARWACVPFGTLIVIYNENDVNSSLPPNDLSLTDGNCRMIIPSGDCTLFERNTTGPSSSNSTIPTSGFISCGSWNSLAMSNGGDSFQVINPGNLTSAEFAVSYANNQNNTLIYFNVTMGNSVIYNSNSVDNNPYNQANWTYGAVPTFETPGSPNNAANDAWISSMNNNCTPFPVPVLTAATNDASCGCNGSATITTTGGIGPYSYSWSNSASTDSVAYNLCAGSYTITVTAANGCEVSSTVVINANSALSVSSTHTDVTCNGLTNGTATISTTGGSGGFTYTWNPPVSTGATASGLAPGTYTVTVSEAGGCGVTDDFIITQPQPLSVSTTSIPATCFGVCNGQGTATVSGGMTPYTFSWSSGETTSAAIELCSGLQCVTITDLNGCTTDTCVNITEPSVIVLTGSATDATCGLPTGSATVNPSGGTGAYSFSWTQGGNSNSISAVTAGSYCVTVADQNGCKDSTCVTVSDLPGVGITSTSNTNATCFGDCNGTASVSSSGGQTPYTYSWLSISSTDSSASSLCQGSYTVIVSDASGCKDTSTIIITEPAEIIATPVTPSTICIGETVSITVNSTGGTGVYSYSWSPSGPAVSPVTTSQYSVVAADQNGCTSQSETITVNVYLPLTVNVPSPLPVCPGGSVTLNTTVSGGNNIYSYSWLPIANSTSSLTLDPAVAGTYSVIVTDGCTTPADTTSVEVVINNSSPVAFTSDTTNGCVPFCVLLTDNTPGSISSSWLVNGVSKAGSPVEYCFDEAGVFDISLSVQGANGCSGDTIADDHITANPSPTASFTTSAEQLTILSPHIELTNTSEDYTSFSWNINDSLFSEEKLNHTFSDTGCYMIVLTAMNDGGCVDSANKAICVKDDFAVYFPNAFSPNGDGINDSFGPVGFGILSSDYLFQVFDRWGNLVYQSTDPLKAWNGKSNNGSSTSLQDVYVFKARLVDTSGNPHTYKGRVTIVK